MNLSNEALREELDKAKATKAEDIASIEGQIKLLNKKLTDVQKAPPVDFMFRDQLAKKKLEYESKEAKERSDHEEEQNQRRQINERVWESNLKKEGAHRALAWVTVGGILAVFFIDAFLPITSSTILGMYFFCVALAFYSSFSL